MDFYKLKKGLKYLKEFTLKDLDLENLLFKRSIKLNIDADDIKKILLTI